MLKIINKKRNRMKFLQLEKEYLQKIKHCYYHTFDDNEYFPHKIRNRTLPQQKVSILNTFSPNIVLKNFEREISFKTRRKMAK